MAAWSWARLKTAAPMMAAAIILVITANVLYLKAQSAELAQNTAEGQYFKDTDRENRKTAVISEPVLSCSYYVDKDFKRSLQAAVPAAGDNSSIIGGIVTHHLLADTMISPFFAAVTAAQPELVFIAGPNHKRVGNNKINTGHWDWQTPYGLLEADAAAVKSLVEDCPAGEGFNLLEAEHSVSSLVPYVKYFIPEARIVPIIIHGNLGLEGSKDLARKISKAAGGRKWIIIGSIDFSHYLPPDEADRMDEITLKAMETVDMTAISRMGNDNLDSPPSLMTILEVMRNEGPYEMKVTGHSNSSKVAGIYSDNTTSYFTVLFYKK